LENGDGHILNHICTLVINAGCVTLKDGRIFKTNTWIYWTIYLSMGRKATRSVLYERYEVAMLVALVAVS